MKLEYEMQYSFIELKSIESALNVIVNNIVYFLYFISIK